MLRNEPCEKTWWPPPEILYARQQKEAQKQAEEARKQAEETRKQKGAQKQWEQLGRPGVPEDIQGLRAGAEPDWMKCANEGGFCRFDGTKEVRYAHDTRWSYRRFPNGVPCSNEIFGDPAFGVVKQCYYRLSR